MNVSFSSAASAVGFESQSGKVYRGLRDSILNGSLKPGARLVRRTLGKQYGTSAIAVAEALWKLESDGLVESAPMYGSRVCTFTLEHVQSEQLLRQALETEVARLCAARASELPAEALMNQARALDEIMSQKRDFHSQADMVAHQNFHMALARHCGSEAIAETLGRVWFRHLMLFNWVNSALFPVPEDWHQRLLNSILSGDPEFADRMMRKHIQFGWEHQIEVLRAIEKENAA
jgi:GntR family transcriptional regulator, rspAB operon transcriptional repressor